MTPDQSELAVTKAHQRSNIEPDSTHEQMANAIRFLSADAVEEAGSGHPGMPMGMADVATVLYSQFLKFDPSDPNWPDRDRFVLSAGHGSMLLYSLLYLTGYEDMTISDIKNFRQLGSKTAGHPEFGHATGIETTTGPLGQGLTMAVGMALAERMTNARFGSDLVDHFTYVLVGDGCLMEGISHEAISFAGHLQLNKLIVLFDDNSISIDGATELSVSDNQLGRFEASGWHVLAVDGHDPKDVASAIAAARESSHPSLIACKTVIGFGSPIKAGTAAAHGAPLGEDVIAGARERLNWVSAKFEIPDNILSTWRKVSGRSRAKRDDWYTQLEALSDNERRLFDAAIHGNLPVGWLDVINDHKKIITKKAPEWATRKASGELLEAIINIIPELVGGSADLTGSNNTKTVDAEIISPRHYNGRYIHYGVREFGMGAIMNGMVLHGGVIPYGGTFLVFADYMRPAIRLSALMRQRVVYVLTHDSIGLGEDGPTHQPVETLASLRAIPNLNVFRPADAVEVAESWAFALSSEETPSIIALTRQGVPMVRTIHTNENLSGKGGYLISQAQGKSEVTLIASGSEVWIALEAQRLLQKNMIDSSVISMPCCELFDKQDEEYRMELLGSGIRVAVEAAVAQGWEKYLGENGRFVGMTGFGASAPGDRLYKHFGITPEVVVETVKDLL